MDTTRTYDMYTHRTRRLSVRGCVGGIHHTHIGGTHNYNTRHNGCGSMHYGSHMRRDIRVKTVCYLKWVKTNEL